MQRFHQTPSIDFSSAAFPAIKQKQWQQTPLYFRCNCLDIDATGAKQPKKKQNQRIHHQQIETCPVFERRLKRLLCMSPLTTKVVHCLAKQCHHISLVMKALGAILVLRLAPATSWKDNVILVWLAIIQLSLCVPAMRHSCYNNRKRGDIFIVCT